MGQPEAIGLLNTGVPLVVLGICAVLLPWLLVPRDCRSHRYVMKVIALTVLVLIGLGCVVFGTAMGQGTLRLALDFPLPTFRLLLTKSVSAALVWGPLLGLQWFNLAQRVERQRCLDGLRGG